MFTQVTVTGTITLSNATPASGATVTFTLNTPITDGTQIVAPEPLSARCNSSGAFTITLNANDDSTTLPTGTYYTVTIGYGEQTLDSFSVIVPHAAAPTVNLFTLAQLSNPNVQTPYVVSVNGQNGIVTTPALPPAAAVASANVASLSGLNTYDGYTLATADVVLLTAQSTASQNGPWVAASGAWTRPAWFASGTGQKAHTIAVINGTTFGKSIWLLQTNTTITVDTSAETWVQASSSGGSGGWTEQGTYGTNWGATQTVNFGGAATQIALIGVANANLTVTFSNRAGGAMCLIPFKQDATGGRTLTLSDGAGGNQTVTGLATGAGQTTWVLVHCPDATNILYSVVGGPGGVQSVTAADTSVVVTGTATAPTIATGTLDVIAADHPPAANWSNNSKKITGLANGTAATDAAAFGQIPVLAAADTSMVVGGTATAPTVATGTLDVIAADHPPAASWSNNSKKITSLANGSAASDAAAFGQIPTSAGTIGGALALAPTAVKTANYTASAEDFVPCDISGGSFTVTLPTAPADQTRVGVKLINVDGAHANALTISRGGSTDVFNKAGGSTSLTLSALLQGVLLQYYAASGIWYVQAADPATTQPLGAAQLGTNGKVGGTSGSPVDASIATVIENDNQVASSGAGTVTLPDVTADTVNEVTLTGNPTLAFPTGAAGKSFTLFLTQDATGSRTVTWPATSVLVWPSGIAPTLTSAASKTDAFSFVWSAQRALWLGFVGGQNF